MDPRSEIKRLLAATGEPPSPPAPDDLARRVRAHLHRASDSRVAVLAAHESWLPRGWEIAAVLAFAAALGAATAEWRLRRTVPAQPPQQTYLAAIDPTLARTGD